MSKGKVVYNPNYLYKDSPSYFKDFILCQDEVSAVIHGVKDDSLFLQKRIIQVKTENPIFVQNSIFSSHLLHSSSIVPKEKPVQVFSWISLLIVFSIILFAIAKFSYHKRFLQLFKVFFVTRLFNQFTRESGVFKERISFFLFGIFLIVFSLFTYNVFINFSTNSYSVLTSIVLFFKIFISICLFCLLKLIGYHIVGFIFKREKETSDFVLNIFVFSEIIGIVLIPIVVIHTYLNNTSFMYVGLILIFSLYVYSLFKGLIYSTSFSKISVYYLFLYLCTLEVLPLFIIAKIFNVLGA